MPDRGAAELRDEWRQIERDARAHALAVLERDERTPLVFGAPIAWAECMYGRTDAITQVHRVGVPVGDKPYTTCSEAIPGPLRWMVLSPALIDALGPCRFCEVEYQRLGKWNVTAA